MFAAHDAAQPRQRPISRRSACEAASASPTFSSFVSLLAILPLAMNQFAIDRAGLTLTLLAPVDTMTLLRGKAVGNAVDRRDSRRRLLHRRRAAASRRRPGAVGVHSAHRDRRLPDWSAPIAAILSAIFPRAVDLNSIGRGSNAHGAAGLLGMLAFVAAAAPGTLLAMLVGVGLQRPILAPLAVVVWMVVALGISLVLFRLAADIFDRRRENLGLTSQRS